MTGQKFWQLFVVGLCLIGALFAELNLLRAAEVDDLNKLTGRILALQAAGKYGEAAPLAQQLLQRAEKSLQNDPATLAKCLNAVGIAYKAEGHLEKSEPILKRALSLREKALKPDHPDVAVSLVNLGMLYQQQGRYVESELLLKRALTIREKALGLEHPDVAMALGSLALLYKVQGRYSDAEPQYKRALAIREKALKPDHPDVATNLQSLGMLYEAQGRYADAEPLLMRAVAIQEKSLGPEHPDLATTLNSLAIVYKAQGRYAKAEPLFKRALAIREKVLGWQHPHIAMSLSSLADLYDAEGRYAEAERLCQQALNIQEKALGPDHPDVANGLNSLASLYRTEGRYAEAEPLHRRALNIWEKALGPDNLAVATGLTSMAKLYEFQGRYSEAEPLYNRSLAIREKALRPDHPVLAASLDSLGMFFYSQGRYGEAEPLLQRALSIREKALGPDHPVVALSLNSLGLLYKMQGRYAESEPLNKRALAIREKALGPDNPIVASSLNNLAHLYETQSRHAEAEPLYKRSFAIWEKALPPDHPTLAKSRNNLAEVYKAQGRYAEAEPLFQQSLASREKALGPDHPDVATSLNNLAMLYGAQDRFADAEPLLKRALTIRERALGPDNPAVATNLGDLARLYQAQGHYAEAEPLADRALTIRDRTGIAPALRFESYLLRAQIGWKLGSRPDAVADLSRALDLAESQRSQASGSDHERADFFASFTSAFEQMVAWQTELGGASEAISAIERCRARSLLDDLSMAGVDLNVGRSAAERAQINQREIELKSRVASLEKQTQATKDPAELAKLTTELNAAREAVYQQYRDQRGSNPVYQHLLSVGAGPPRLRQLQQALAGSDRLVLLYMLGDNGSYVVVISPDKTSLVALNVAAQQAEVLGIEAGPLTAKRLKSVLVNDHMSGLMQQLTDPKKTPLADSKLAALWLVLIPESERAALVDGKVKQLIVLPDGPLANVPFEALVVEPGPEPKYLLDVGPPIVYAPSATVLFNLSQRATAHAPARRPSVLSVGDPNYSGANSTQLAVVTGGSMHELAASSRYARGGGVLQPLPSSGIESKWVADVFAKLGITADRLNRDQATEAAVRKNIPGRSIVHLACHGLTDQQYGNFFGALALTPRLTGGEDSADDGFLTLAEICELDLKSCELAILSACDTNYGPQQQGEGTWNLSRGFLVAGARRVVASNWLVDDEAASNLISIFCSRVAEKDQAGSLDYAQSLQAAKRWIRQQDKWKSPYYWGTFVLVGPN